MRNMRRTLLRLMRLFRRKNLVSPLSWHGRIFQYRIVVLLQLLAPNDTRLIPRWLSLTLSQSLPAKRTSPPSLVVYEDATNKKKLPHRLYHVGGKKYRSSWFTVQVLMMSRSITFHSVYFELSTASVSKRETIEGSRSLQSSSVFSRCLIWFLSKKSQKIAKNRNTSQEIAMNRKKSIRSIAIFSQMKKLI